jgi:hypothetical protein
MMILIVTSFLEGFKIDMTEEKLLELLVKHFAIDQNHQGKF